MNQQEHLLSCLAEEAGELVHACGKALRFGLEDGHPNTDTTNEDDILNELTDIIAVACLLLKAHPEDLIDDVAIQVKREKVLEHMSYAQSTGHLEEDEATP